MKTDFAQLAARLLAACTKLTQRDHHLLEADVNERSITHHLAFYVAEQFPEWDVDAEYNRDMGGIKRLRERLGPAGYAEDTTGRSVFPDIIVHHRGTAENYLVIEAKKTSNPNRAADICKLKQFTSTAEGGLGYKWGAFVVLHADRPADISWFHNGQAISDLDGPSGISGDGAGLAT